ncbi:MAG: hypothetical protein AB7R90_01195 [Reyranellaceae bacterium]
MPALPSDFARLLSPRGRRLLEGRHPLAGALAEPRTRFVSAPGLIEPRQAALVRRTLERALAGRLERIDTPIPPEATWDMTRNYAELLPKTARVWTAYLESKREAAWAAAEETGLIALLRSAAFHRFAEAIAGKPLRAKWGMQVLCYGAGDYSGPHNDHHPEDEEARAGYIDLHLGFVTPAVRSQKLVYAKAGHFSEAVEVARDGLLGAYRLPFWHYTTPLEARRGRADAARRWVLLGTFLYKASPQKASPPPSEARAGVSLRRTANGALARSLP